MIDANKPRQEELQLGDEYNLRALGTTGMLAPEDEEARYDALRLRAYPKGEDYQTCTVGEAFDWVRTVDELIENISLDPAHPMFVVVFTSKLKPGNKEEHPEVVQMLHEHDATAFRDAVDGGGKKFFGYFCDIANEAGEARSYCFWSDPETAKVVSDSQAHGNALKMIEAYEYYSADKFMVFRNEHGVHLANVRTGEIISIPSA